MKAFAQLVMVALAHYVAFGIPNESPLALPATLVAGWLAGIFVGTALELLAGKGRS